MAGNRAAASWLLRQAADDNATVADPDADALSVRRFDAYAQPESSIKFEEKGEGIRFNAAGIDAVAYVTPKRKRRSPDCELYELGMTQTGYAQSYASYVGETVDDGAVILVFEGAARDVMEWGDSPWYDPREVRPREGEPPLKCDKTVVIEHEDHPRPRDLDKKMLNPAASRKRGKRVENLLNSVDVQLLAATYLTARVRGGSFLSKPLRHILWHVTVSLRARTSSGESSELTFTKRELKVDRTGKGEVAHLPYMIAGKTLNQLSYINTETVYLERGASE
jgi:hypothetical protein